jgi:hypothetical protein
MEKIALCSRGFWDKEILDKCNELADKNKTIKDLEDKIKELEAKIGPVTIVSENYADYCDKLTVLHEGLTEFIELNELITVEGISIDNEIYINDSIESILYELTKNAPWSRKNAYTISKNLAVVINNLSNENNINNNSWTEFYNSNSHNLNQIIFDNIHDLFWSPEPSSLGLLDDWEHGVIFVTKCVLCKDEMYPLVGNICEDCLFTTSFS